MALIRIAVDLFLLSPDQYRTVVERWPADAEFARARDMVWPGPEDETPPDALLIRDMVDPEEEAERQERALWRKVDLTEQYERQMRAERARQRFALKNSPDATVFWLPNVTENSPDDPMGRHWYPFSGPPPERQQWLVWREIAAANVAYLAWPEEFTPPRYIPEGARGNLRLVRAEEPSLAVAHALSRTLSDYRQMPYDEYLRTPHWLRTRDGAVEAAGYCCQSCGHYRGVLDAHHLTYERRGAERPEDLRVLCRDCHEAAHAAQPKGGE